MKWLKLKKRIEKTIANNDIDIFNAEIVGVRRVFISEKNHDNVDFIVWNPSVDSIFFWV